MIGRKPNSRGIIDMIRRRELAGFFRGDYKPRWNAHLDLTIALIVMYIASGVAVNAFAKYLPVYPLKLPFSGNPPVSFPLIPGTLLVGLIFVMRDYTQRLIGDWVAAFMLIATIIVYFCVDRDLAYYSALAFLVSEGIDQVAFHALKKEDLKDRILWSSAVATLFDGALILHGLNELTWPNYISHYAGKMLATFVIWLVLWHLHNKRSSLAPAE
ncbi:hypothetical protein [Methylobacterium frigidaeris]|nr:hypothetical protein [Methylobacterium frigidaeris]